MSFWAAKLTCKACAPYNHYFHIAIQRHGPEPEASLELPAVKGYQSKNILRKD